MSFLSHFYDMGELLLSPLYKLDERLPIKKHE